MPVVKEIRFIDVGFPVTVDRLEQGEIRLLRQTEKETGNKPCGARVVGPAWLANTWIRQDGRKAHVRVLLDKGGKFSLLN